MFKSRKLWGGVLLFIVASGLLVWLFLKKSPIASPAKLPPQTIKNFPHEIFDRVLKQYVSESGLVDYQKLSKDRADLDLYVAYLNQYSPDSSPEIFPSREEALAYYLNTYNALVLTNVLENPGLQNLSEMKFGFFYRTTFFIGKETYNLYELENNIVRPRFQDPRVHFALNCASLGCPKLPTEAFTPEKIEAQLERETQKFLSEERNVKLQGNTLSLSQLFEFYTEDFVNFERAQGSSGTDNEVLLAYINRYRNPKLSPPSHFTVEFFSYDWTLNKQ